MWEIITRFERVWLKIVAAKLVYADTEIAGRHYPHDRREWIEMMWQKGIDSYAEFGMNIVDDFGTGDPHTIGMTVRNWLLEMMTSGPIFVTIMEWPHAIEVIRKLVWNTLPLLAAPGTIRWDYGHDSAYLSNIQRRPIDNLIHSSGNLEEAAYEIDIRFPELN